MNVEKLGQLRAYADTALNGVPIFERRRVIAVAIARGLASKMPLPSSPVTSPNLYYNQTFDAQIGEWVSKINEVYQLDVNLVRDTAYMFWKLAYDLAYERTSLMPLLEAVIAIQPDRVPSRIVDTMNTLRGLGVNIEHDLNVLICTVSGCVETEADVGEL